MPGKAAQERLGQPIEQSGESDIIAHRPQVPREPQGHHAVQACPDLESNFHWIARHEYTCIDALSHAIDQELKRVRAGLHGHARVVALHRRDEDDLVIERVVERELPVHVARCAQAIERRGGSQRAHQVAGEDGKAFLANGSQQRFFVGEVSIHRGRRDAHATSHLAQRKMRSSGLEVDVPAQLHQALSGLVGGHVNSVNAFARPVKTSWQLQLPREPFASMVPETTPSARIRIMSGTLPANPPAQEHVTTPSIELVIAARARDLGGFEVRRALPSSERRLVGPFIFFDEMGPAALALGAGLDVRPHPHIALATVTYLFEGEIVHRDSLGSIQPIRPGDVNWMVAGRGIAHSERSSPEQRERGVRIHGIQSWVALPQIDEETAPSFDHHPVRTIPRVVRDGVDMNVIAGSAFGVRSPVRVFSPTLYVHAQWSEQAKLVLDTEHHERAMYVVSGTLEVDGGIFAQGELVIFRPDVPVTIVALLSARAMLLGGAKLEGERHVFWNFVSSSLARIERAKDDWKNGRFAKVVNDESEFIPLPDG